MHYILIVRNFFLQVLHFYSILHKQSNYILFSSHDMTLKSAPFSLVFPSILFEQTQKYTFICHDFMFNTQPTCIMSYIISLVNLKMSAKYTIHSIFSEQSHYLNTVYTVQSWGLFLYTYSIPGLLTF